MLDSDVGATFGFGGTDVDLFGGIVAEMEDCADGCLHVDFTGDSIKTLEWVPHIRKRPGMYIGEIGDGRVGGAGRMTERKGAFSD